MRLEDKEVDGLDLERQERLQESELVLDEAAALEAAIELSDVDLERRDTVLAAMRAVLAGEHVVVDELRLPARELRALEALQAAVDGRDSALSQFVYASDRRDLLEQALAVLQPSVAEVPLGYELLVERVAELRIGLKDLEDAQDELLEANTEVAPTRPAARDDDPDADTSLTGPERPAEPRPKSTLTGPERPAEPRPPSTLSGARGEREAPPPARPPTTLGDPAEIEAASPPWWRPRSGG